MEDFWLNGKIEWTIIIVIPFNISKRKKKVMTWFYAQSNIISHDDVFFYQTNEKIIIFFYYGTCLMSIVDLLYVACRTV